MFDISSGELILLGVAGVTLIGRKDLPRAFNYMGVQMGRIVGLLQGARARADRFASQNELRQLQNELRAGLRELDAVKTELILSTSAPKQLGSTVSGANRQRKIGAPPQMPTTSPPLSLSSNNVSAASPQINPLQTMQTHIPSTIPVQNSTADSLQSVISSSPTSETVEESSSAATIRQLAPRSQAVAAVAEEEWVNQGIGFKSKAEQQRHSQSSGVTGGSVILANLLQETLIYDQYDRVVQEQEDALQSKVDRVQEERLQKRKQKEEESKKEN